MDPEDRVVDRAGKIAVQILDQRFRLGTLGESLMIGLVNIDAGLPTFSRHVDADIDM